MNPPVHGRRARLALAVMATLVLAAASTVALAAGSGQFGGRSFSSGSFRGPPPPAVRCSAPALPGTTVDVTLSDMGGGMMGGRHRWGPREGWDPDRDGPWGAGMMRIVVDRDTVPAGTVTLRARNVGALPHELMVFPLPAAQAPGQRPVGRDGRIDEVGSLGAAGSCGSHDEHEIVSGSMGWSTLTLPASRYELVCNLPSHYAAGMYAELDVS